MKEGVYTALITPFLPDNSLDEEGLLQLLNFQAKSGVDGVVVLGTTGETPTLSGNERQRIIRLAKGALPSSLKLIVGTGTNSTTTTIDETKRAEDAGADSALIVTPYYNKPSQEGLFLHFQALAQATSLPLIAYNIQGRTGINLHTSTLKRLAEIPSLIGVKEASGNIQQISEVLESIIPERPDFKVFSGDDNLTLPLMALGGHGIISVVSNLVPKLIKDLFLACFENRWKDARQLHYDLSPLFRGAFIETNPVPIKALMEYEGLPAGPCRLPLSHLSPENEKKLRHLHETLKLPLLHG